MLLSFYFALSAHPAFIGPIDELNAIVLRLSSVHKSQEILLLPQFSSDLNFVWIVWKGACIETALGQHLVWVCSAHCVSVLVIFSCSLVFDDCRTIVKYKDYVAVFIGACWTLPVEAW